MRRFLFLLTAFVIIQQVSFATGTIGSYDPGLINSQYMKEIKIFQTNKSKPEIFQIDKPLEKSFTLKQVTFVNNQVCNTQELESVVADKIGKEMAPSDLVMMERSIMKYYQSKGYTSAIASVSSTDKNAGIVIINLQEGQENSVQIETPKPANPDDSKTPIED